MPSLPFSLPPFLPPSHEAIDTAEEKKHQWEFSADDGEREILMERERGNTRKGETETKVKGGDGCWKEGREEVGGEETFLLYLWFYLRKKGSLFGPNYICFLTIIDKTSHGVYVTVV